MIRTLTLTLGPLVITGLVFSFAPRATSGTSGGFLGSDAAPPAEPRAATTPTRADDPLVVDCQRIREKLMKQLGSRFVSLVHVPFVLVGNGSLPELERLYRETIVPTQRALGISYFDHPPAKPVAVVLLSSDEAYQDSADRLDGQRRAAFAGYYERGERRIVINLATGDGTIAHELTHALAHFDFPEMPEWLDEGLASLHEEARFSDDALRLIGLPNWRGRYLRPAIERGTLRTLREVLVEKRVRSDQQAIDYAHARYFCLFLQQRRLLEAFYRKFRESIQQDPTGERTLASLFATSDLELVDRQFRAWVLEIEGSGSRASKHELPAGRQLLRDGDPSGR